jgi:5-formyltetrahydrofolate cyclo-ligase
VVHSTTLPYHESLLTNTKTLNTLEQPSNEFAMALLQSSNDHKADVRLRVWHKLRQVAFPDSRFHFDFSSFIPDFEGSQVATNRLLALPSFRSCSTVFIAPDNCLEYLREQTLKIGVKILMTTYGIRRGFWLLDPAGIEPSLLRYAATLDGMEKIGRNVTLREIILMELKVGLMVTGTGAINIKGIRFGKGHGFFDLEWGMLSTIGVVSPNTITTAIIHDCQLLDEELEPEEFDTICDLIITPSKIVEVDSTKKPVCGIIWERLQTNMLEEIPPLQELRSLVAI